MAKSKTTPSADLNDAVAAVTSTEVEPNLERLPDESPDGAAAADAEEVPAVDELPALTDDLGTPRRGNDDEFSEALLRSANRRGRPSAKIGSLFLLLGEELDGPPDGSSPGMSPAQVEEVLQAAVDTARNIRKRDQKAADNGLVSVTLTRHAYGANPGESLGLSKDKAELLIRSGGAVLTEKA